MCWGNSVNCNGQEGVGRGGGRWKYLKKQPYQVPKSCFVGVARTFSPLRGTSSKNNKLCLFICFFQLKTLKVTVKSPAVKHFRG